ncbi:MAG TPA: hypothetical protein VHY82_15960 [Acetobacteraceae bacterium]|jgi:hypothetical protein|nr:hypothetical protein [Acetobacteraceae bacterium]
MVALVWLWLNVIVAVLSALSLVADISLGLTWLAIANGVCAALCLGVVGLLLVVIWP